MLSMGKNKSRLQEYKIKVINYSLKHLNPSFKSLLSLFF